MFKLNKMTDYAVVMMADMARMTDDMRTAPQLADATGVPLPTVSKLLKNLANSGLMQSQRGASGGYSLARAPERITVALPKLRWNTLGIRGLFHWRLNLRR